MQRNLTNVLSVAVIAVIAGCSVRMPPSSSPEIPRPTPSGVASAAPTSSPVPIPSQVPTPAPGGRGLTAELVCEEPGCGLSLLDADGEVLPGWPVSLEGFCSGATTDGSNRVYVACEGGDEGPIVHGFDAGGQLAEGWPLRLPAPIGQVTFNDFTGICGRQLAPLALASDGTVFVSTWDEEIRLLHAIEPNGGPRAGWPRAMPGDTMFGCGGFALLADGTLRMWGYEGPPPSPIELGYGPFAQRTVFTALDAGGSTLPGWPFGSTGTASGPLFGADGTLYHVSEAGNVWAHGTDGEPKPGWPYESGRASAMSPYLAPDGRLVLLSGDGEIVALGPNGAAVEGWPRRLLVNRASECVLVGDIDCFSVLEPAFGPDGTLYVALAPVAGGLGGSILALGPDGSVPQGWPFQLPDRTQAADIAVDGAGNLILRTGTCTDPCWETVAYDSVVISPAGQVVGG